MFIVFDWANGRYTDPTENVTLVKVLVVLLIGLAVILFLYFLLLLIVQLVRVQSVTLESHGAAITTLFYKCSVTELLRYRVIKFSVWPAGRELPGESLYFFFRRWSVFAVFSSMSEAIAGVQRLQ